MRAAGAGVFALALLLYAALLPIGLAQWDPGEMQTVPFILGIPHAPGFPLYVLAGWLWSHLVPFGEVATRMTVRLAYAQYVERSFGNRQVITDDAPPELIGRWVRERPVYVIPLDEHSKPAGVQLAEIRGSWPRIYRVVPGAQ